MSLFSKLLIISGIFFLIFGAYLVNLRYSSSKMEFSNLNIKAVSASQITPARIMIPTLGINNKIIPASINNNKWQVTGEGVSYLTSTPTPGSKGNSVLYGHNWESILGNLTKIKPGEKIVIVMNNGEVREFIVKYTTIVDPSQTNILDQSSDNRITIYTCTGFLDSKRFVATAVLDKSSQQISVNK